MTVELHVSSENTVDPVCYLTFLNVLEAVIFNGMALCSFMIFYLEGSAPVFNFIRNNNKMCSLLISSVLFLNAQCCGNSSYVKLVICKLMFSLVVQCL